jgi:hypothetical protein
MIEWVFNCMPGIRTCIRSFARPCRDKPELASRAVQPGNYADWRLAPTLEVRGKPSPVPRTASCAHRRCCVRRCSPQTSLKVLASTSAWWPSAATNDVSSSRVRASDLAMASHKRAGAPPTSTHTCLLTAERAQWMINKPYAAIHDAESESVSGEPGISTPMNCRALHLVC